MRTLSLVIALSLLVPAVAAAAPRTPLNPDAMVDLRTADAAKVGAVWKVHEATLVEADHHRAGPDKKPSGAAVKTLDVSPRAAAPGFDDKGWLTVDPGTLEERRGTGKVSMVWYRLHLTIPAKLGALPTRGTTAVLELVVDDYAEVTVDGKLPLVLGAGDGPAIGGWNTPARIVVGRDVRPGQKIDVAILAVNGPLSEPPPNYVWIRSASLELYKPERLSLAQPATLEVVRKDAALDAIVGKTPRLEKLADGFRFTEGPVWVKDGGYLLFSDPNSNVIHRLDRDGAVSVFRTKSGYSGVDIAEYGQPGSNGLTLDREGRLVIAEHGNHRISRLEKNGTITVLADAFEGKRLNSPNDLVYRSDGALYFTDPPFGLPKFHDDRRRELPFTGVFCLKDGKLSVVSKDLTGPNGLAFSPDEKWLYVSNWDPMKKVIMRYAVRPDGSLGDGTVFFDMGGAPGEEALDGLKVDARGNLYSSGPGGLWIISAAGKHLGTLVGPELAANVAWGDADGKTLYWTARTGVYRIRLQVAGIRP